VTLAPVKDRLSSCFDDLRVSGCFEGGTDHLFTFNANKYVRMAPIATPV
jgi:hypothetical protein